MFLKTTVFICLVLPRISSSHPTQFHQLQYEQQQQQQQQQQQYYQVTSTQADCDIHTLHSVRLV